MSDLKVNPATVEFLKKQNAQRGKRRAIVSIVGLLLVAGIAFGGYEGWKRYQASHQAAVAKAAAADLKPGREGWEKMRTLVDKGEITQDQARDAMRANFEKEEQARMDAYFKTPAKDRDKYLDGVIDDMQKRMAEWQKDRPTSRPTTRPDRGPGGPGGPGPTTQQTDAERAARAAARADNQSPVQRAQQSEFRAAMRARMAARGIQMPGRFGGGGGGPGGGRGPGGGGGGGGR